MKPVNHQIIKNKLIGNNYPGTINTRPIWWGGGSVVGYINNQRELNTLYQNIKSYSSKVSVKSSVREVTLELDSKTKTRLETIWNLGISKPNSKIEGLFNLMKDLKFWIAAYKKLSVSRGYNTKGTNHTTIDDTSIAKLETLQKSVINGTYRVGGTRRLYIPKPLKPNESRPLGIPDFEDIIVQEVVRSILEIVYEPRFMNNSHGFRPNRSTHTAIKYIRAKFRGAVWYIKGDISKYLNTINHKILIKLLNKTIKDKKFIQIIAELLRTTVVDGKTKFILNKGVPQGSILSPLLSNIVLNELDIFMVNLILEFNKGKIRSSNQTYAKYRRKYGVKAAMKLKLSPVNIFDPKFKRLSYVRYADDFLIGIIGSKEETIVIKEKIKLFLKNNLDLSLDNEKTKITNINNKKIPFLGFLIDKGKPKLMKFNRFYTRLDGSKVYKLVKVYSKNNLLVKADINKIINKLSDKRYCDKLGNPKPNFSHYSEPQILIIKKINLIINGICSYYSVSDSRKIITYRIQYILRYSIAMVLAAKYKLKTKAAVFKITGKNLRKLIKPEELNKYNINKKRLEVLSQGIPVNYVYYKDIPDPDLKPYNNKYEEPMLFKDFIQFNNKVSTNFNDPLQSLNWKSWRGSISMFGGCHICNSFDNVEMYHIRPLKYIKNKTYVMKQLHVAERKQYPLCKKHYLLVQKLGLETVKRNYDLENPKSNNIFINI